MNGILKIAVLISGRGTNLQALIEACADPDFPATIALVISNVPDAPGLSRAQSAGIPTTVIDHKQFQDRPAFDSALDTTLKQADVGLICLAGFMRLLTAEFVDAWRDRLINVHPSLLPAFKGLKTHQQALEAGVRIAGCTVHFVRPEMDSGPIIAQAAVPVLPNDDTDRLAARILEKEHLIYPLAVRLIAEDRVRVKGEIAIVDNGAPSGAELINPGLD